MDRMVVSLHVSFLPAQGNGEKQILNCWAFKSLKDLEALFDAKFEEMDSCI